MVISSGVKQRQSRPGGPLVTRSTPRFLIGAAWPLRLQQARIKWSFCKPGFWPSLIRGFFDLGDEFYFGGRGGVGDEEGGHCIGDDEAFLE